MTTMVGTILEFAYNSSWYPDFGATNHITPDIHNLTNKTELVGQDKIVMGNGIGLSIKHIGQSSFQSQFTSKFLSLNHLLHVPSITKNLLSVSKFPKDNTMYFEFFPNFCYAKYQASKEIPMVGRVKNGLYVFDDFTLLPSAKPLSIPSSTASYESSTFSFQNHVSSHFQYNPESCTAVKDSSGSLNTLGLWHHKLGHSSLKIVKFVMSNCNIYVPNKMQFSFCSACYYGKIHKLIFSSSNTICTQPLQLIHSNLWGPFPLQSSSGYYYYIHFVDAYSRFAWIYLLRHKSDAF